MTTDLSPKDQQDLAKMYRSGTYGKTPAPRDPLANVLPLFRENPLFPPDFPMPGYLASLQTAANPGPAAVTPEESREAGHARILADMDRAGMAGLLLEHLWMPTPGRCSCQARPDRPRGQFYTWWADHVAVELTAAGFTAGWAK